MLPFIFAREGTKKKAIWQIISPKSAAIC